MRSPPTPTSTWATTSFAPSPPSTRSCRARRSPSTCARSCGVSRRSASATRESPCSSPAASSASSRAVGEGKHLRFRVRDRGRPAGSAIAFGLGSQLDRYLRVGRYDIAFRLEENTWNGTSSPQLVVRRIFETPDRYLELRDRFVSEWRAGELSPDAQAVFAELGLGEGGTWRSLLESETFRALLDAPLLAEAA